MWVPTDVRNQHIAVCRAQKLIWVLWNEIYALPNLEARPNESPIGGVLISVANERELGGLVSGREEEPVLAS